MNNAIPNWGKLVRENRAKAAGIPWSEAELKAIANGMSPDDVRNGILTPEEAQAQPKDVPLRNRRRADLIAIAKEMGIQFDEMVVTRGDLILEIENQLDRDAKAEAATNTAKAAGEENAKKPLDS